MEDNYGKKNDINTNDSMGNDLGTNESSGATSPRSARASKDADELKDRVKETVQKGVAAVAGALKGFSEEAKKHNLAESTKEAIHKAGETTRQVVGATAEEFQRTRQHLKEKVGSSGFGSSSLSGGMASPSSYGTDLGTSRYGSPSAGLGDTGAIRPSSESLLKDASKDPTMGLPDIRKTDLVKSDEDLME